MQEQADLAINRKEMMENSKTLALNSEPQQDSNPVPDAFGHTIPNLSRSSSSSKASRKVIELSGHDGQEDSSSNGSDSLDSRNYEDWQNYPLNLRYIDPVLEDTKFWKMRLADV